MIQLDIEMTAVISIRMEHNYNDEREKKTKKNNSRVFKSNVRHVKPVHIMLHNHFIHI